MQRKHYSFFTKTLSRVYLLSSDRRPPPCKISIVEIPSGKMSFRGLCACLLLFLLTLLISPCSSVMGIAVKDLSLPSSGHLSSFLNDLKNLQTRINYTFENVYILGRAMTHASYSHESNKALSILGSRVVEGDVVLHFLDNNVDITAKDLNRKITEVSNEASCASSGMRLGLQKIVRVSARTNSSAPGVVCDAFRAIFGAVVLDSKSLDAGGRVFMGIRDGIGMDMALPK
ncbi:OLC1v1029235C1 [Oldenlandia corymbosa var. corymbosa]|uniref:OLC1v1029235C1 n=1 Tax=Oldenlandia corymbosa var. corymbosa TaxID=529605 RepID=A0AAV1CGR8_OLDCO|nr:OLC1v1029235C1 [Oldenlandia corymbosa var. corymbosa]